MTTRLLRTAFFSALLGYIGLLLLDTMAPGFVSTVFSAHIVGAAALVLGVAWSRVAPPPARGAAGAALAVALGAVGAGVVWCEGTMFGDARALLALGVLVLPVAVHRHLSAPTSAQ